MVLQDAHRPNFKRAGLGFLSVYIQIQFGASASHIYMEIGAIGQVGKDSLVDKLSFLPAVNNPDPPVRFLL